MDERMLAKLDRVIVLLSLAFADQIAAAQAHVLSDPVAAAILSETADSEVSAGELKRRVAVATSQSERTVSRRLTELTSQGWLQLSGSGPNVRYRSTGL